MDSDAQLMNMWDQIKNKDGIYLQEELGVPQTQLISMDQIL